MLSKKNQDVENIYQDEHQMLEQVSCIFLNKERYVSAAGLFSSLVKDIPESTMAWYGLASALYGISSIDKNINKLKFSVQCVLRSIKEDESNEYAKELYQYMINRTHLRGELIDGLVLFNDDPDIITELIGFNGKALIADFQKIEFWQERMQIIMHLECNKEPYTGDLYLYALKDKKNDVKMATLKRVGFWGNNRDVRDSLEKMVECKSWDSVGPYLEKAINSVKYHYPEYKEWAEPLLKIVCKESHIR